LRPVVSRYLKIMPFAILVFIQACSSSTPTYYAIPDDYRIIKERESVINKYYPYLKGKVIFIDPGHGGDDRKNMGSLGLAVEADVNLRIGLALRDFLTKVGAVVLMSRDKDETVDLYDRIQIANYSKADIFISIHHNAGSYPYDKAMDYTAAYYHGYEGTYEFEPCNRDIARYIQRDLSFAMGTSGGPDSFDGTYPDCYIIDDVGIAVLREATIPAVLLECAFHSSQFEEKRLIEPEFNTLQAWGIFKGLGRYFEAGVPKIMKLDEKQTETGGFLLTYKLEDVNGIDAASIKVYNNASPIGYNYNADTGELSIMLPAGTEENTVRIICANGKGNHSFPFYDKIKAMR